MDPIAADRPMEEEGSMRTSTRAFAGSVALLTVAALTLATSPGSSVAAPSAPEQFPTTTSANTGTPPGEETASKIKDNRRGRVEPTSRQRERAAGLRARWNALGTPAVLAKT